MKHKFLQYLSIIGLICLLVLQHAIARAETDTTKPTLEQLVQARKQWTQQSLDGDAHASAKLGALYLSGSLGSPDYVKARTYLKHGATVDLSSLLAYGHLLMHGLGGEVDTATAEEYFKEAASQDSMEGLYLHSKLVLSRKITEVEITSAVKNIYQAAQKGFPPALATMGEFYRTGTFVNLDPAQAIEYYQQAANGGYTEALATIAEMYLFAELEEADIQQAKVMYRQALSEGVKSASYSLAFLLYNQGSLDPDSLNEAFRTAEIAAYAWDERCQYLLGLMYYEGKAIDQDMEKAYFWLDIAASAGVFESHHIRALATDSLTTEQIQSVKLRAKKWFNDNHDRPHKHIFIDNAIHRYK